MKTYDNTDKWYETQVNIEKKGIFEGVSVGNRDPRYVDVSSKPSEILIRPGADRAKLKRLTSNLTCLIFKGDN